MSRKMKKFVISCKQLCGWAGLGAVWLTFFLAILAMARIIDETGGELRWALWPHTFIFSLWIVPVATSIWFAIHAYICWRNITPARQNSLFLLTVVGGD